MTAKDCYSFDVAALPKEGQPDHVSIAVLVYGKLSREMRISPELAQSLYAGLGKALAEIRKGN